MKKFLFLPLMAILATNTYANSGIDTVKQIVSLAESGEIFNLAKTAEHLNLKDEIYRIEHKPVASDNRITYNYPINTHQVIESISYDVSFGGLGDYDLTDIRKGVTITFKSEHCLSPDELQATFGKNFMAIELLGPPSLITRQGVRYTEYLISAKNNQVSIKNNGCEFSVMGRATFE